MLQKGDIVYIHRQVDANWFEGEHHGRAGIFPTSYVEVSFFFCHWKLVLSKSLYYELLANAW